MRKTENIKKEFNKLFQNLEDDKEDVEKGLEFINKVLRNHSGTKQSPLIIEIITVIKRDKPNLFRHMKARAQLRHHLKFIFELEMDYETAKERLF